MINSILSILHKHNIKIIFCHYKEEASHIILCIENNIAKIICDVEDKIYNVIYLSQLDDYITIYSNLFIINDSITFQGKIKYLICFDNNTIYPLTHITFENKYMKCKDTMNYVVCINEKLFSVDGGTLKICKERIYEKKNNRIDNTIYNTIDYYETKNVYFTHSLSYCDHLVDFYFVNDLRESTYRMDICKLI